MWYRFPYKELMVFRVTVLKGTPKIELEQLER